MIRKVNRTRSIPGLEVLEDRMVPAGVSVQYAVTQDWGSGFQAQVKLTNSQTVNVNDWKLEFDYSPSISTIWDARIVSHTGTHYVIGNAGWNSTLAAGGMAAFGFIGNPGNNPPPPTGYKLNGATLGGTTPPPPSVPALAIADVALTEGNSGTKSAVFTVKLSAPAKKTVTVNWATANGTALSGSDYVAASGKLSFSSGQTSKTITVKVKGDATVEPDETFLVKLSTPIGATLARAQATGTIRNDDSAPPPVPNPDPVPPPASSSWPTHVFAPYVDMTLWPTYDLAAAARTGLKYFTLAFVVADSSGKPAWGGYSSYGVGSGDFDAQMKSQIAAVRSLGGDVMVSLGGANGAELAQAITDPAALKAAYQSVINAYGLTHIDFDIEGWAVADKPSIDRRSQAIADLQRDAAAAGRELRVSFTLPVLPSGLTADGVNVLQSALSHGARIDEVNIMAMDYGDGAAPNPQGKMGDYAIEAATSLFGQLRGLYGTARTDAQLWAMVGVTPMIGRNDVTTEVFDQQEAQELLAFAQQKGIGFLAMWSLNRDQANSKGAISYVEPTSSSLAQQSLEFAGIFKGFTK